MGHRCFISFKTEDWYYKNHIQQYLDVDMIDHSLDKPIPSMDFDYIMRKIREEYLSDSTVTIFLIGQRSNELLGADEQQYIKAELQSSLYHGVGNTQNGILGIVLPNIISRIYGSPYTCPSCGQQHNYVGINDGTVIREFGCNYYIQNAVGNKCSWKEDERYCVLVKWDDFIIQPNIYIDAAFDKRSEPIAEKTRVRP